MEVITEWALLSHAMKRVQYAGVYVQLYFVVTNVTDILQLWSAVCPPAVSSLHYLNVSRSPTSLSLNQAREQTHRS